jgi:DNA-binding GntR family transcriptional regulator
LLVKWIQVIVPRGMATALVDRLAATLQARVLSGEIPTGARLRQGALAEEFGVSRTPVREALRKLQATGIVDVQPNRGALVRAPTAREIREAYEVRAELEGLAAELAATRIRDDQLRELRKAVARFRRLIDTKRREVREWGRANDLFHQTIQDAAGNERLIETLAHLHRSFPRDLTGLVLGGSNGLLRENLAQHEAVLDAIERHEPEAARQLMTDHIRRAGELVVHRFESN